MVYTVAVCLLLPFLGTAVGSLGVFGMKKPSAAKSRPICAFAAGVMTAASFFSLILPSIGMSAHLGRLAFLPAAVGLCFGGLLPSLSDRLEVRFPVSENGMTRRMIFAVVLHNIPEGMAVGVILAGLLYAGSTVGAEAAFALSFGIALQNLPEGLIIALPLAAEGKKRVSAFLSGVLSGIVEPIAGLLTLFLSFAVVPILPYLLGFAAGAMLSACAFDMIPDITKDGADDLGAVLYLFGFTVMMALDAAFG